MKLSRKFILTHLIICVGYLMIPFVFMTAEAITFNAFLRNPFNSFTSIFYTLLLVFFYLNYYYLIPKFYATKKYSEFIIILISIFLFLIVLFYFVDFIPFHQHLHHHPHGEHGMMPPPHPHEHRFENDGDDHDRMPRVHHPPPIMEITQLIFLYSIGIFITLYIRAKKYINTIEQERNNAELSFLKSQINPHFLFNTFNSIYSLAIKERADKTANGMLKLSGMMRYVVSETSTDFVPLEKELNYINDFIELQKLRLAKEVHLNYSVEGMTDDKQIAPLLLIPFIENAFKHGVNPDEDSVIHIHIHIKHHELEMLVSNNKVTINPNTYEQMGFGIENTKTRLNLLYPNSHQLQITDNDKVYKVELKISLL